MLALDDGLRRGDIGPGLIERDLEVAVVDPRQHLAGLHMLVIADENLIEVAGDFRGNRRVVGLHIGVIGRDQEATHRPVIPAIPGRGGEQRGGDSSQQRTTDSIFFRGLLQGDRDFDRRIGRRNQFVGGLGRKLRDRLERGGLGAHGALRLIWKLDIFQNRPHIASVNGMTVIS